MKLISSSQMTELDALAQTEFGIPAAVLMESAAKSAWEYFSRHYLHGLKDQSIVFVAGAGNNGGDALVMARYCAVEGDHRPAIVLAKGSGFKGIAETQREITAAMGIPTCDWESDPDSVAQYLSAADWIVDGLCGTGLSGSLRSPQLEIVRLINSVGARVAALDAPSGVGDKVSGPSDSVRADLTLSLGLHKRCLYDPVHRNRCGRIVVVPFTLPPSAISRFATDELLGIEDLPRILPPLAADAYKRERGVLAVFAGTAGTAGAAVLCSTSALSAGAGLVTVFADDSAYLTIAAQLTSVMVRPESDVFASGEAIGRRFSAAVVGPGWGTTSVRRDQLPGLIGLFGTGVVDADGLTLISTLDESPSLADWVLTPHPGELARLLGSSTGEILADMYGCAQRAAKQYGAIVVAKASTTIIAAPDGRVAVVDGANPGLATAGSGDVLSGVIGAILARGLSAWDAACAGTIAHAEAGRRLAGSAGFFRSEQLSHEIASVMGRVSLGQ